MPEKANEIPSIEDVSEEILLRPLRSQIDAIDAQLLDLLNQRAKIAQEVGAIKMRFNSPVFRPERERAVIAELASKSQGPLDQQDIAQIWRTIMSVCRALENKTNVAFLGPSGTFAEQAMYAYFGHAIEPHPCATFDEIFRVVKANLCQYGIVPIENSTEGIVSRTLDLFLESDLLISGEIIIAVHHNLMCKTGSMNQVHKICAHAQALAQCQRWLNSNYPDIERQAVSSNAEAARLAAMDPSIAAIAIAHAADQYGLQIVHQQIQDNPNNRTRFAVMSSIPSLPSGKDQTSVILSVKNQAGALFEILEPLAKHNVSMTRLESRPAQTGSWEYYFFIDLEGHIQNDHVRLALDEIRSKVNFFKYIGSYPRGD